ncbi:unnamed protein product [Bathycoccus prasinos]
MGPIGIKAHLMPFMPNHPSEKDFGALPVGGDKPFGTVSAAPYGCLKVASERAILNANYMAKRLENHYPVLFKGKNGTCAHEFILDMRPLKDTAGVEVEDISEEIDGLRLPTPTMSWPVSPVRS